MNSRCGLLLLACILGGCSQTYYRKSADRETYRALQQHIVSPSYSVGRTRVEPAPISRIADLTNPDHPPKPPDDPAAAIFMRNPGDQPGYRKWEKNGVLPEIEPPNWEQNFGLSETRPLKLTQDQAVEIALLNSRNYQTRLESLYLQALALTLNRFQFDLQFFSRRSLDYAHVGTSSLPAESNTLVRTSDTGFTRNFAAGGQLLVDFANSFVWEFTGKTHQASGSIGATLVQPLLRGFGRNVRLEALTQAERDTLYAVRDYARFRKLFWASITVEDGGYLQILRLAQNIRNARANLRAQEETYALYQKLFQGGRTQLANVDQVFQALLGARRDVISAEIELQNQLDRYKILLGIPPRLQIELDDSPLDRFILVDPAVEKLREEIDAFDRERKSELEMIPPLPVLQQAVKTLEEFAQRAPQAIESAEKSLNQLAEDLKNNPVSQDPEQTERAQEAYNQQKDNPKELREQLRLLNLELKRIESTLTEATREQGWKDIVRATREIAGVMDSAIAAESVGRIYTLRLPDQTFTEASLLPFAKDNRLDLQNVKAQVTDAWRRVSVTANALKSDVTVRMDANIVSNPSGKNPLNFGAEGSRLAAGVSVDGPLNRQFERNVYRQSQIEYQRARRSYMELSDLIELDLRTGIRELERQRINFEIARQQLLVAVRQLALERRLLAAPVQDAARRADDGAATLANFERAAVALGRPKRPGQ